jgi:hypothetical protein
MLENGVKGLRMGQIINCLTGFDLENGVEELDIPPFPTWVPNVQKGNVFVVSGSCIIHQIIR